MLEVVRTAYDPARKRGVSKRLGRFPASQPEPEKTTAYAALLDDKERDQFAKKWAAHGALIESKAAKAAEAARKAAADMALPTLRRAVDAVLDAAAADTLDGAAAWAEIRRLTSGLKKSGHPKPSAPVGRKDKTAETDQDSDQQISFIDANGYTYEGFGKDLMVAVGGTPI